MDPGGLGQLFKLFLGLPHGRQRPGGDQMEGEQSSEDPQRDPQRAPRSPGLRNSEDEAELFKVFTDPLEMTRFFEEQMDDMLRNFGQGFFGGSMRSGPLGPFGGPFGSFGSPNPPLPAPGLGVDDEESKRDFMLRDEGQPTRPRFEKGTSKLDEDISDQWEKLLGARKGVRSQADLFKSEEDDVAPSHPAMRKGWGMNDMFPGMKERHGGMSELFPGMKGGEGGMSELFPGMKDEEGGMSDMLPGMKERRGQNGVFRSWGSSVSQTTIRGADGAVETTRTERCSDGTERVTVTKSEPSGNTVTETRVTQAQDHPSGWQTVPRGGMDVPGPRQEMLAPPPADRLYSSIWEKFFGK